eukprot:jgi/Mesvir1/18451/Mv14306-RA.2
MDGRVIVLVDMDCFYAQLAVQQWDGLIAINYPARAAGIDRHARVWDAKKKCPELVLVHVETIGYEAGGSSSVGPSSAHAGASSPHNSGTSSVHAGADGAHTATGGGGSSTTGSGITGAASAPTGQEGTLTTGEGRAQMGQTIGDGTSNHGDGSMPPPPRREKGKVSLDRYRVASHRVFAILRRFSSLVERASIDEAYLDITAQVNEEYARMRNNPVLAHMAPYASRNRDRHADEGDSDGDTMHVDIGDVCVDACSPPEHCPEWAAVVDRDDQVVLGGPLNPQDEEHRRMAAALKIVQALRRAVRNELGYTCSAGIAHNKLLAKVVAGMNKPNKQTLLLPHAVQGLMEQLPLKKLRNFGGKMGQGLMALGCDKAGDVQQLSVEELTARFGDRMGPWVFNAVRGIHDDPVVCRSIQKSMLAAKSFSGTSDMATIERWMHILVEELSGRMEFELEENRRQPRKLCLSFRRHQPRAHLGPAAAVAQPGDGSVTCGVPPRLYHTHRAPPPHAAPSRSKAPGTGTGGAEEHAVTDATEESTHRHSNGAHIGVSSAAVADATFPAAKGEGEVTAKEREEEEEEEGEGEGEVRTAVDRSVLMEAAMGLFGRIKHKALPCSFLGLQATEFESAPAQGAASIMRFFSAATPARPQEPSPAPDADAMLFERGQGQALVPSPAAAPVNGPRSVPGRASSQTASKANSSQLTHPSFQRLQQRAAEAAKAVGPAPPPHHPTAVDAVLHDDAEGGSSHITGLEKGARESLEGPKHPGDSVSQVQAMGDLSNQDRRPSLVEVSRAQSRTAQLAPIPKGHAVAMGPLERGSITGGLQRQVGNGMVTAASSNKPRGVLQELWERCGTTNGATTTTAGRMEGCSSGREGRAGMGCNQLALAWGVGRERRSVCVEDEDVPGGEKVSSKSYPGLSTCETARSGNAGPCEELTIGTVVARGPNDRKLEALGALTPGDPDGYLNSGTPGDRLVDRHKDERGADSVREVVNEEGRDAAVPGRDGQEGNVAGADVCLEDVDVEEQRRILEAISRGQRGLSVAMPASSRPGSGGRPHSQGTNRGRRPGSVDGGPGAKLKKPKPDPSQSLISGFFRHDESGL